MDALLLLEEDARMTDATIETGMPGNDSAPRRTHNAINRHTGAVLDGSLFSLEALPPGSRTTVCLWLHHDATVTTQDAERFLADLVAIISSGLTLGGNCARGIGLVRCNGPALYRVFDCTECNEHAAFLDEQFTWKNGTLPTAGRPLAPSDLTQLSTLRITLELCVPTAQDLLIADGQGLDYEMEPQRVRSCDGKLYWRIPGSSLRGVFRAWCTRLAACAGRQVADDAARWNEQRTLSGDDLAWGGDNESMRKQKQNDLAEDPDALPEKIPCPIMRLFGSSYSKSRIHFSDAISSAGPKDTQVSMPEQLRMHVAVDRITGGANDGFLFDNTVLTSGPRFKCDITIKHPEEEEVRWLAGTLRALHLGILRIGSSKAGGRLAIAAVTSAEGKHKDIIATLSFNEE